MSSPHRISYGQKLGPMTSMAVATTCFSFMGVFVRQVTHLPTTEIVFFRSLITFVFCLLLFRLSGIGIKDIPLRNGYLWIRGIFGCVSLTMTFAAIKLLPLAVLSTIVKLAPMIAAVMGGLWLKDKARPVDVLALVLGFIGVIVIRGFDPSLNSTGVLLAVAASFFSAVAYTTIRKMKNENPTVIMFFLPLVAVPVFAIPTYLEWVTPTPSDWGWLFAIGVCVQVGQYFMTAAFQHSEAARVGSIIYTEVVLALLWGYMFFSETITNGTIVGIVIILTSALLCSNIGKTRKAVTLSAGKH